MQNHPHWQKETEHLAYIRDTIAALLDAKVKEIRSLTEQEAGINRDMWEEIGNFRDLEGISEFMQFIGQLKQNMAMASFNRREVERLDRMYLSPYFARIDFGAAGETPEPIYIGISTLMDDDTAKVLVHDWRAPVSSLFYDWEPGSVEFRSPAGIVRGTMTLKRQYRLEGGRLVLMFDAGLAINDDILQEILAGASGGHMRQIVASIQKEQNRAIRFEDTRVLAVQGAAGSGKTSIAMHRAAYLLYRHRNTIKAENLVILSPNALLGESIADVLPELGEERIEGIPFTTLAEQALPLESWRIETATDLMESTLVRPDPVRLADLRKKTAPAFLSELEAFVAQMAERCDFPDLVFEGTTLVSGDELARLYAVDFRSMGIGRRLERIRLRIGEQLTAIEKVRMKKRATELEADDPSLNAVEARVMGRTAVRQELQRLREELDAATTVDPIRLYRRFLSRCTSIPARQAAETVTRLEGRCVPFEDLAPILYLSLAASLCENDTRVRHVLIDEAQDFSRLQYAALRLLYPRAGFTLLGDANQNIRLEHAVGRLDAAAALLAPDDHAVLTLRRTYRCTRPISRLADRFRLEPADVEHFGRPGPLPRLLTSAVGAASASPEQSDRFDGLAHRLLPLLGELTAEGRKTMALLTRTMAEAETVHAALLAHHDAHVPSKYEKKPPAAALGGFPLHLVGETYGKELQGLLVLPSWLAKGLEFESVALLFGTADAYADPAEKGLLHTACTRALHRLYFVSLAGVPSVLADLPAELLEREQV